MAKYVFNPTNINELKSEYDVVIVGSGSTGLVSALQAHELGLKPVIFEKMPKLGGNTTRASSGMNAAETYVQLKNNVVDSFDEFYNETLIGGGNLNDPELLNYFTTHSALSIDWLKDHGIILDDLTIAGGMKKKRVHRPSSMAPIGAFLITELLKLVDKTDIPVFTNVKVLDINEKDNKVSGVTIEIEDGTKKEIASNSVVLATGGYGANQKLIGKYRPDLESYNTTNQPGALGDGISLATKIGAATRDMDQIQVHPTVQQDTSHTFLIGEAVRGEGAILVNKAGERFVNELDTRKNVTNAINGLNENGAFLIFDRAIRDRVKAIEFYDHVGLVKTGQTLAELANENGINAEHLEATVSAWNDKVKNHNDSDFNRETGMDRGIEQAPFYSIHIAPAIHYTMGGLKINTKTQVLDNDGNVIPGLYAAGEVAGGLHGNNRIGGNSIAETVIFGRQAGMQVYNYQNK